MRGWRRWRSHGVRRVSWARPSTRSATWSVPSALWSLHEREPMRWRGRRWRMPCRPGRLMGEQSDPIREMEACRIASIEPHTTQANRGSGTGAVGGSHGDRRADSASGSCRHAASVDRASDPAAACICLWGGFCVCENTLGWEISRKPTTLLQAEAARSAQAALRRGVLWRRQGAAHR